MVYYEDHVFKVELDFKWDDGFDYQNIFSFTQDISIYCYVRG